MYINKNDPLPAYQQLKKSIIDKIQSKEYLPGQSIPSERQLSADLSISRMTVRQAFKELEADGILFREKGKGTFVARPLFEQKNIMSFTDFVQSKGLTPQTKILSFESVLPSTYLMDIFDLKEKEQFYHFKRLRLAENIPIAIEEVYIPQRICPNLSKEDLAYSLYKLLKDKYGHVVTSVKNTITALAPNAEHTQLLNIPKDIPLLSVSGINLNQDDLKIYYESSFYRADEYKYSIHVNLY